ncbi:MAG: hypothetical protein JWN25_3017 [Verrucomicrobiales bacterium]|nr:hypothetical protein [Verrucomicrobiales bacterium]
MKVLREIADKAFGVVVKRGKTDFARRKLMKSILPLLVLLPALFFGCEKRDDSQSVSHDSAGAAGHEPQGGSLSGAGGAGPGYDGSGHGGGKYGTIPTNSTHHTNQ